MKKAHHALSHSISSAVAPIVPGATETQIVRQGWLLKKRRKKMQGERSRSGGRPALTMQPRIRPSLFRTVSDGRARVLIRTRATSQGPSIRGSGCAFVRWSGQEGYPPRCTQRDLPHEGPEHARLRAVDDLTKVKHARSLVISLV